MNVRITTWKVKTLIQQQDKINEQPAYQRGEVWKDKKKGLLIDSMLRGIDLPKIYLRKLNRGPYEYEVADGQQRLAAIYSYYTNSIQLPDNEDKGLDLSRINGKRTGGLIYEELPEELKNKFDDYQITVAIIEDATNQEIRTLFGRLQEGDPLVPAEKRNAIISSVGNHIDNFSINHKFFHNCFIPELRFKRQDYMAHVVALIAYNNTKDLKADLLLKLYLDKNFKLDQPTINKINEVLDHLAEIDEECKIKIYKKFHFIDFFWFLFNSISKIKSIDIANLAQAFDTFEASRLKKFSAPESLIDNGKPSKSDRDLYDYIIAFKSGGAEVDNVESRHRVFNSQFTKYLKF